MRTIMAIVEVVDETALELAHAARSLGEVHLTAAVFGAEDAGCAELARYFDRVVNFPLSPGAVFDAEHAAAALTPWLAAEQPFLILLSHTNNGLDLAPLLAARLDLPMLADCLELGLRDEQLTAVRTLYAGKVHARVVADAKGGALATLRPGAFDGDEAIDRGGRIETAAVPPGPPARRRLLETVAAEAGSVDITQAEILVAVGRGIEEQENLEIVQSLAAALDAEVACTRPIVDKNWLPKSRQVGTSGQSVSPKVYLAIGVSGSFQHLGGVKGKPFLVAINQDAAAPIFAVADVGVVGDLFDLVPLLEEKIRARKG